MSARAVGIVLVTCLSLLMPAESAVAADPDADDAGQRTVTTVTRGYGDRAVRQATPRQRVDLRFRGRRGDRVRLAVPGLEDCATVELRRRSRELDADRAGYVRLRRSGWHRFSFRPCRHPQRRHRLQLTLLRVTPLAVDGRRVRTRSARGYDDALRVEVPRDRWAVVRRLRGAGTALQAVLPPRGPRLAVSSSFPQGPDLRVPVFVRAGRPMEDVFGPHAGGTAGATAPLRAGQHVLLFPRDSSTWRATSSVRHPIAVDGPQVHLDTSGVRGRSHQLEFAGAAGQWVRLADATDGEHPWMAAAHQELTGPDGAEVASALVGLWRLPETGTFRLTLTTLGQEEGDPDVRLESVREIGPVATDGTPRTFTTEEPGEVLVAPVESLDRQRYWTVGLAGPPSLARWALHVRPSFGTYCGGRPPVANGCGDFVTGLASGGASETGLWAGSDAPYYAILVPAPTEQGELSLGIRPRD